MAMTNDTDEKINKESERKSDEIMRLSESTKIGVDHCS